MKIPFTNKRIGIYTPKSLVSHASITTDGFIPLDIIPKWSKGTDVLKDFLEIPELNAIINIRARAMASGKKDAISKLTDQPTAGNQSLVQVLRNPNWFQGQKEFWRQSSLWHDIYGNEYIYFLTPVGMPKSFKAMFTLDPSKVTIHYKQEVPYFMSQDDEGVTYTYELDGRQIVLDKRNLIHLNDNRVQASKILEGTSKIESLKKSIDNIRAAYAKRNIALHMPVGIISNNGGGDALGATLPMLDEERKPLEKRLKARDGTPIFTQMNVSYANMEVNSQRMGLFEETREDTGRICDMYGVSYDLIASVKSNALSDGGRAIKEANKQMHENVIVPDVKEKDSAINNHIGSESLSWEVRTDFSELPVFSEDVKEVAETDNINMTGINTVLNMPISEEGKVILLVDTYDISEEKAKKIVKPNENTD